MYRYIAFIKFLITSTNQHGVHSPFVYHYTTNCLYNKQRYKVPKHLNVLLKSISYFKTLNIELASPNDGVKNLILNHFPKVVLNDKPIDLIYVAAPQQDIIKKYFQQKNRLHNDSVVFINGIYKNKENTGVWEAIKNLEAVTVTVDMYYCGLVFFRKEQAKEHFKIRI